MKKYSGVFVLLVLSGKLCSAQAIANTHAIEIRAGATRLPGAYAALTYEHITGAVLNVFAGMHLISSHYRQLCYLAPGLEAGFSYYTPVGENTDHLFEVRLVLGAVASLESEPWIYRDRSFRQRLNYGVQGELCGQWAVSEAFSLTAFVQQLYFFHPGLASLSCNYGLGLAIRLDH